MSYQMRKDGVTGGKIRTVLKNSYANFKKGPLLPCEK
jgi:hypothetical protein